MHHHLGRSNQVTCGLCSSKPGWVQLLQIIKQLTYSFKDCKKFSDALCDIKEGFYWMRQGEYESKQDFYKWFKNHVAMMDEVGAIFADDSLVGQVAMMNG